MSFNSSSRLFPTLSSSLEASGRSSSEDCGIELRFEQGAVLLWATVVGPRLHGELDLNKALLQWPGEYETAGHTPEDIAVMQSRVEVGVVQATRELTSFLAPRRSSGDYPGSNRLD